MQQPIRQIHGILQANLTIPGSRCITNRALILAALADGVSELSSVNISQATHALINALRQLGIVVQLDEPSRSCIVAGCNGRFPKKQTTVWCEDSGTIARFLLAACSATPGAFYFDGSTHLRKKNFGQLLNILCRQGTQLIPTDAYKMPFTIVGADTQEGGEIILNDTTTSQIASALLMIAPYSRSPFTFTAIDPVNHPLVEMTCSMMAEFGVLVHRVHQGQFMVPVPQRYQANDYVIEPDLALASYFFAAAAATGGEVTIQPTKHLQSKQPNVKLLSVLERMGCRMKETARGFTIRGPEQLHGVDISIRDFSDTFVTLAAIAPFANGPTRISHLGRLRHQESERLLAVKAELIKLGIHVESGLDWIKIYPGNLKGGLVNAHNDPRIAMAFSIIGLKVPGVIIDHTDCVTKIYPDFFTLWNQLSEKTNVRV